MKLSYSKFALYKLTLQLEHDDNVKLIVSIENEGERKTIGFIHYDKTSTLRSYDLNKEKPTRFSAKLNKMKEIVESLDKNENELGDEHSKKWEDFELDVLLGSLGIPCNI